MKRSRDGGLFIEQSDGTVCALPAWIFDADECARMSEKVTPRVSIGALCSLRVLLDAQCLLEQAVSDTPPASLSEGAGDEATQDRPDSTPVPTADS